jgi:hypothetical protein
MPPVTWLRAGAALAVLAAITTGSPTSAAKPRLPGHIAVIVVENHSYAEAYVSNPNPYLSRTLTAKGTLLTDYYGVGHASLDNYLAMVSGQEPNPFTQSDCPRYVDAVGAPDLSGQFRGAGCVYPASVRTLADQLDAKKVSWRGYMEDMGLDPGREQARCGQPGDPSGAGVTDNSQAATTRDQYAARHNPFVYFHSVIDSGSCQRNVVPLTQLAADLRSASTTPRFSFITPDLCSDGHDTPCVDGRPGGLNSVDAFLRVWVPRLLASPAFAKDGLVIITSDESEAGDSSSCCGMRPGALNRWAGISGEGGGRVGTLLLGPCVRPGAKSATPLDHYSLLRTLEDVYGVPHLGLAGADGVRTFVTEATARCR